VIAEPLRFEDDALFVLDQRDLPGEVNWIRCASAAAVATCIRDMAVRGAPAIGVAAAYGMALAQRRGEDLAEAGTWLRETRPTAVNLGWAVDRALTAAARSDAEEATLLDLAIELHREQERADRALSELGAAHFEPGDRALTHCNAGALATAGYGTACGVLHSAWQRGVLAQVWVDETRPLLQGARLTAWELERAGIPHRVVADSAAGSLIARGAVDRIVVGADRIAANGDVANKIGTYPLAVLAARHGVPFYVAAPLSTLDPATADGAAIPIEERDPGEVTRHGLAFNPAFDVTPAELVTAIFTEAGVLEAPYEESIRRVASS
jgi:methylthioribose-1-phosphate isomerase